MDSFLSNYEFIILKFEGGVITVMDASGKPVQVPASALNATLGQSTSAIGEGRNF